MPDPQCQVTPQISEAVVVDVANLLAESAQVEEESWTPHWEMAVSDPVGGFGLHWSWWCSCTISPVKSQSTLVDYNFIFLTNVVSLRVYNAKLVPSSRALLLKSLSLMTLYSDRTSFHREV